MFLRLLALIFVAGLAGACDDNTGPQTTGVVQETNVPCDQATCTCDREFVYYDQVSRECDGLLAQISVCSDVAVCEAALAALAAQVTTCADPASPFDVDVSVCDAP